MYPLLRNALFRLDAERAHELSLRMLRSPAGVAAARVLAHKPPPAPREVMGLRFPNPVGLAAGLDKNGRCIEALAALGFGFIEVGTVTPRPQPGNPRPRLFRLPRAQALINRMGFNNDGVDALSERLRRRRWQGIVGVNIGKNRDTPVAQAADDYVSCLRKIYRYADYVTVNLSSPNTPGLRQLQFGEALHDLLARLEAEREQLAQEHGKRVPLAVKIAPDLGFGEIDTLAAALRRHRIDAVIATNTSSQRAGVEGLPHADESGGLSGAPITGLAAAVNARLCAALGGEVPVIAAGGIMSAVDALNRVQAGAALVQVFTGLIYRGPRLLGEIGRALSAVEP